MLEMDVSDEVVMKSESQEAGRELGELGRIIEENKLAPMKKQGNG